MQTRWGYYISNMSNTKTWEQHTQLEANTQNLGQTNKACNKLTNEQTK